VVPSVNRSGKSYHLSSLLDVSYSVCVPNVNRSSKPYHALPPPSRQVTIEGPQRQPLGQALSQEGALAWVTEVESSRTTTARASPITRDPVADAGRTFPSRTSNTRASPVT
jgi:hypothetical protein